MTHDTAPLGPSKHDVQVAKYDNHRTPADGDPDDTVTVTVWLDADGQPITDEAAIADLETRIQKGS